MQATEERQLCSSKSIRWCDVYTSRVHILSVIKALIHIMQQLKCNSMRYEPGPKCNVINGKYRKSEDNNGISNGGGGRYAIAHLYDAIFSIRYKPSRPAIALLSWVQSNLSLPQCLRIYVRRSFICTVWTESVLTKSVVGKFRCILWHATVLSMATMTIEIFGVSQLWAWVRAPSCICYGTCLKMQAFFVSFGFFFCDVDFSYVSSAFLLLVARIALIWWIRSAENLINMW